MTNLQDILAPARKVVADLKMQIPPPPDPLCRVKTDPTPTIHEGLGVRGGIGYARTYYQWEDGTVSQRKPKTGGIALTVRAFDTQDAKRLFARGVGHAPRH